MKDLSHEELKKVDGGFSIWGTIGAIAGVTFLIGVIDGFVRPLACNE